jgi:phasin family protein
MADEADKAENSTGQALPVVAEAAPKQAVSEAKLPATPASPKAPPVPAKKVAPAKQKKLRQTSPKAAPEPRKALQAKSPPKELPMAKQADFTNTVTDAIAELQTRTKAAYDKSAELAGEASEFTKGNIEALVESSKIVSENLQDLGKAYADEAKAAFETLTADMKEFAAVKSPTELFQLQSRLIRRNFDSLVAFGSKSSETMVKLANEAIAPLSSRASLAAEKFSKAA